MTNDPLLQLAQAARDALDPLADARRALLQDPEHADPGNTLAESRTRAAATLRVFHNRARCVLREAPQVRRALTDWEPAPWPLLSPYSEVRAAPWELARLVDHGAENIVDDERWGPQLVTWARDLLLAFEEAGVPVPAPPPPAPDLALLVADADACGTWEP